MLNTEDMEEKSCHTIYTPVCNSPSCTDYMLRIIDAASRLTNTSMLVYDFDKRSVVHKSEKLLYMDDATISDIQRESSNPYWSLVTQADLNALLDVEKAYFNIIGSFSPEQQLKHTLVINFNIFLKQTEHNITQKFTPLTLRPDGTTCLGLFSVTQATNETSERAAIFGNGFRYAYNSQSRSFVLLSPKLQLTPIEKAILNLSSKGFSTERIAKELYRSPNTIKTHKKRLFDKLNVSKMAEALMLENNYNLY